MKELLRNHIDRVLVALVLLCCITAGFYVLQINNEIAGQLGAIAIQENQQSQPMLARQSQQLESFRLVVTVLLLFLIAMLGVASAMLTRNRQTTRRLWYQRKQVSDSINKLSDGFILTDKNGNAIVVNSAIRSMCPTLAAALDQGQSYQAARLQILESGELKACETCCENQQEDATHPTVFTTDNGLFLRVSEQPTDDGGLVITMTDISDLKYTEDKLHKQANYDYLTGIANRSYFTDRLQTALARARRQEGRVALIQFDLDHFKQVNDTLGHAAGDELLVQTAKRIKDNLRDMDLAARTGGDEFAAILDQVEDHKHVQVTADRILKTLQQQIIYKGIELEISASIGIAMYPDHADDMDSLMNSADIACYRAKAAGRNNYQIYGADLQAQAIEAQNLETRFKQAIDNNALQVKYQPHLELATGKLSVVEAFSRWHDSSLGDVSPARFIPLANRTGLIARLGEQMLDKVFAQLKSWDQLNLGDLQVAINLSERQLQQPQFTRTIDILSDQYGVPPSRLLFEITESVIANGDEQAYARLHELAERDIGFLVDDYGSGNSSLHMIANLPIRALKIDGRFIATIEDDDNTRDIVKAMISGARDLQLDTIAECVETQTQADILLELGCTSIQGYLIGAPQSADDLVETLISHKTATHTQHRKVG